MLSVPMMKVLVCGSREWTDDALLISTMEDLCRFNKGKLHVIEGGQEGADIMARRWAIAAKMPFTEIPARWNDSGKAAGPIRNRQMLDLCRTSSWPSTSIWRHPRARRTASGRRGGAGSESRCTGASASFAATWTAACSTRLAKSARRIGVIGFQSFRRATSMGLTRVKLENTRRNVNEPAHTEDRCLCGKHVAVSEVGVKPHRARRHEGNQGQNRKARKGEWCPIPALIEKAVASKNASGIALD